MGLNIGGLFNGFKNIANKVADFAKGVTNIAGKVVDTLSKPASALIEPFAKKIGETLGKIPFAGKFLGPIAENLLKQGATALLGAGPLSGIGFLSKIADGAGQLSKVAQTVGGIAGQLGALGNPQGQANLANIFAHKQAASIF
ncbi:hypothetical protein LZ198_35285 [Myxococcus sp. K15C18031901]|uniref:hypothetical protein n=1 Tax=Myxococcus dinghuensis TaxID=2906761 RepID=UPI0020A7C46B|nr:hypothetical protein [Myxococcus dinghuensis]MCP3104147.1 hypothetical protein [Myxococcus dinghuensis]